MADNLKHLQKCTEFEWDHHNADKIWDRHRISPSECEQIFFNRPLIVAEDVKHSGKENCYYALGHTDISRLLFVVFTVRKNKIRIISARDMSRKERRIYQSYEEENSEIQK